MESITPNYYAARAIVDEYVVRGVGFNQIPDNAVGLYAFRNDAPLAYRETPSGDSPYLFNIVSKSDTEMVLKCERAAEHSDNSYLGGIVSANRETVYWENTTNPLP